MSHAPNSPAARDVAYTLHGYTNLALHEERGPTIITRGEGIWHDGTRLVREPGLTITVDTNDWLPAAVAAQVSISVRVRTS